MMTSRSLAAEAHDEAAPSIALRVLSLGAGVRSITLAFMAAHGDITPMPDCAIFPTQVWSRLPISGSDLRAENPAPHEDRARRIATRRPLLSCRGPTDLRPVSMTEVVVRPRGLSSK